MFRLTLRTVTRTGRRGRALTTTTTTTGAAAALCVAGLAVCGTECTAAPTTAPRPAPSQAAPSRAALTPPASALRRIPDLGPNPTGLEMYLYVPRRVRPHPAMVVAIHYCTNVPNASLANIDHPKPTWTHSTYVNQFGEVEVDAYSVAGADHNLGFHFPDWAQYAIQFFGLTHGSGR